MTLHEQVLQLEADLADSRRERDGLVRERDEAVAACEGAVELIEAWRNGIIKRAGITWKTLDDAPPALKALHAVVAKAKAGAA